MVDAIFTDSDQPGKNGIGWTIMLDHDRSQHFVELGDVMSVRPGHDERQRDAKQRKKEKFTALLHHVSVDLLRGSFLALKRRAAPGVDGVTWEDYEVGLEGKLLNLDARIHSGE